MLNIQSDYYHIIKNKIGIEVIGLCDEVKFCQYLQKNKGIAPDIPEGVTKINENLFKNINGIKQICLPYTLDEIPSLLFKNNMETIINYANFYTIIVREMTPDRKYQTTYKLKNIFNLELFNDYCIKNKGKNPRIPEGVTSISDYVFKDNTFLEELELPQSTVCMCKQGCKNCVNLKKVTISKNYLDFGEEVFMNCKSLKGEFLIPKTQRIIRANVFKNCNSDLVINVFGEVKVKLEDFNLKGNLESLPNLLALDFNNENKSLVTNNQLIIYKNNKVYKINKDDIEIKEDSLLGFNGINKDEIFIKNKGVELLEFLQNCKKYKIKLPMQFILFNTPFEYIENYCKLDKDFKDSVLLEFVKLKKDSNTLTIEEYSIIFVLALLTGFFSGQKEQSVKFLTKTLINEFIENNKFNFVKFLDLFKDLLTLKNLTFNEIWSKFFAFDSDNFYYLIKELEKKENGSLFLKLLINNCILDKTNLYEVWSNINTSDDFVKWACEYGDGSYIFDKDGFKENTKILKPFLEFYSSKDCFNKILDIMTPEQRIEDFIFYNNEENNVDICIIEKDVAKLNSKIVCLREFEVNKGYKVKDLKTNDFRYLETKNYSRFKAKIIAKSDIINAYLNLVMGTCANINANGVEYLYESYIDRDCQPFIIYKVENNKEEPIATFRINVDRFVGAGYISSLEVMRSVQFCYTSEEKLNVIKAFYEVVDNFVKLYNSNNEIKITEVTMGQVAQFNINNEIQKIFPLIDEMKKCNEKRKVVAPSEFNHFLVWNGKSKKI